jgi:cell division protein FtsL
MLRFTLKYVAVIVSSLLVFTIAHAGNRHAVSEKENAAIAKMQERMNKNTHRAKYNSKALQKSALKK